MNLIVNAFAFKENYGNSMQLNNRSDDAKLNTYMKNLVVSLVSSKKQNPEDEVMLVATDMPMSPYKEMLEKEGIKIKIVPFDEYVMPKDFPWALAFYKLCVIKHLSREKEYDKLLLIDTDTITMGSYSDLWQEADHGLLLYSINHTYTHKDRMVIKEAYNNIYPDGHEDVIHYGGEFICGPMDAIEKLSDECLSVLEKVKASGYNIPRASSDEVILSIAALHYRQKYQIVEAGAYIYRYWTENLFYLVATNTVSNPVCIWHFPVEKDTGFLLLFDYYKRKGEFPPKEKVAQMLGIVKAKRPFSLYTYKGRWMRKKANLKK